MRIPKGVWPNFSSQQNESKKKLSDAATTTRTLKQLSPKSLSFGGEPSMYSKIIHSKYYKHWLCRNIKLILYALAYFDLKSILWSQNLKISHFYVDQLFNVEVTMYIIKNSFCIWKHEKTTLKIRIVMQNWRIFSTA